MAKRGVKIAGRITSLVIFVYLVVVAVFSLGYGLWHLSKIHPYLVGIPTCVGIGVIVTLFVSFFIVTRQDIKRQQRAATSQRSQPATTSHLHSSIKELS